MKNSEKLLAFYGAEATVPSKLEIYREDSMLCIDADGVPMFREVLSRDGRSWKVGHEFIHDEIHFKVQTVRVE